MLTYHANRLFLPDDIIRMTVFNLPAHDLAQLSRTCKGLNEFAISRLWTHLEFHHSSFHEQCDKKRPTPIIPGSARFYHWGPDSPGYRKLRTLLEMLHGLLSSDVDRFKALCARVRSICTVLEGKPDFWQLLPYFVNLETVEIHGYDQEAAEAPAFNATAAPLNKLRFVKLAGYIPTPAISWILASGNTIERLELELLKEGIPLAMELEEILAAHPEDVDSPLRDDLGGDGDGWASIPRPLSGFSPRGSDGEYHLALPKLRYLYLCQPSDNNLDSEVMQNYFWSTHAETTAHEDWERILKASSSTLETLMLEQKIGIEDTDPESEREHQFIRSDKDGLRSERLIKVIDGVLQKEVFPVLKSVQLKGIAVGSKTPGGRFLELLKGMNIRCEARLGDSCTFDAGEGYMMLDDWEIYGGVNSNPEGEELLATV
ncbi:hypothetical protein HG530_001538 [Fusarium avenaceum]|nr:hypothetical protein HG530_001538 [Fusarium avenaceum]